MQPWEDKKWRGGVLRPVYGPLLLMWIFALVFIGIGAGVCIKVAGLRAPELNAQKLLLLFPAIGLIALCGALLKSFRMLHYRGTQLRIAPLPGVIGGKLSGELILPAYIERNARIRMLLASEVTVTTTGSRNESSVKINQLYQDQITIPVADLELRRDGCAAPFTFIIPYGQLDETANTGQRKYRWFVKARASVEGFDLDLEFNVPVYNTPASDPNVKAPQRSLEELEALLQEPDLARGVRTSTRQGRTSYINSGVPALVPFMILLFFTALFGGVTAFLASIGWMSLAGFDASHAWQSLFHGIFAVIPCFMALVFGLITLLMLLSLIMSFVRRETWIADGAVHQQSAFFGWRWDNTIPRDRVKEVYHKETGSMGDTRYFTVYIAYSDPRPSRLRNRNLEVACKISQETEGLWLAGQLKQQLGLA